VNLTEGNGETLSPYDLVVVDGANTSPEILAAIKRNGRLVLGYLLVGTIEKGRWWYAVVKP
jgi:hypothetical protein